MRYQRFVLLFTAIALSSLETWAAQRTFVSAGVGDDLNPCSRSLPCRSFGAALLVTDPNGEVIALDSGGYGVMVITQAVSVISPAGVYAGITATSGNGVTVNAGDTARVVLRNLSLKSMGASNGIDADTVSGLVVDGCLISGFGVNGILFNPTTSNARLYVNNVVIRRSPNAGINVTGGTGIEASVESSRFYDNAVGVYTESAQATVRGCIAGGGLYEGYMAGLGSRMVAEECVATNNATGFVSYGGAILTLVRCDATSNSKGLGAYLFSTIYVSDSTIAANDLGVYKEGGSFVSSRGNNTLRGNTTDGVFNGSFSGQ